ncbi:hypothetical protein ABFX02_13G143000 [Erythranthe guttata]
MDRNYGVLLISFYVCFAAIFLLQCDAATRTTAFHKYRSSTTRKTTPRKFRSFKKIETDIQLDSSNTDVFVSPPYESLPPFPLPENTPQFCVDPPPLTPQPPSTVVPSPIDGGYTPSPPPSTALPSPTDGGYAPSPPPSTVIPSPTDGGYTQSPPPATGVPALPGPPETMPFPNPPTPIVIPIPPTPTEPALSPPPYYYEPSPPSSVPNPPFNLPSPSSGVTPSPRFLPPIVFPPPTVPPPPHRTPATAMWCVAKASVPDPIILEAMNYACGSGADCDQIQPSGSCFSPNTLFAHASYAFNSYWQRTKVAGGTCDFGGTAILVTVDPSKLISHPLKYSGGYNYC